MDNTNWNYYYKICMTGELTESNLLYTPTVNPEGTIMCMHYGNDTVYRKDGPILSEELIDWFFEREVKFLKELSYLDSTPKIYEIDYANRKIFIEWNKETLSQIVNDPSRSLDNELRNWQEQLENMLVNFKKHECYKMSLYPHCFYISKNGTLKTIDYYSVVPYSERFIERKIIESIIGTEGAYRFDHSTDSGQIDFKKFFEITLTQHLENYWPSSPFAKLFKEIHSHD
jgi:hypothetical protein